MSRFVISLIILSLALLGCTMLPEYTDAECYAAIRRAHEAPGFKDDGIYHELPECRPAADKRLSVGRQYSPYDRGFPCQYPNDSLPSCWMHR